MDIDDISNRVIGCAIDVHRRRGSGLLESTHEPCSTHELRSVEQIQGILPSQLGTDIKLGKMQTGLLSNYDFLRAKDRIKRFVLGIPVSLGVLRGVHRQYSIEYDLTLLR